MTVLRIAVFSVLLSPLVALGAQGVPSRPPVERAVPLRPASALPISTALLAKDQAVRTLDAHLRTTPRAKRASVAVSTGVAGKRTPGVVPSVTASAQSLPAPVRVRTPLPRIAPPSKKGRSTP